MSPEDNAPTVTIAIDGLKELLDRIERMKSTINTQSRVNHVMHQMIHEYTATIDLLSVQVGDLEMALQSAQGMINDLQKLSGPSLLHVN